MKTLFAAVFALLVSLGGGYAAEAVPSLPVEAEITSQVTLPCSDVVVLRYQYRHPDGTVWVIFKEPNKDPYIYLRWVPGNDEAPDEIWAGDKQLTYEELIGQYPTACDAFKKA